MEENCEYCIYCGTFSCERYGCGMLGLSVYEENDSPCHDFAAEEDEKLADVYE